MNENEEQAQHNRLTNPHRSHASKIAWKRHRASYDRGNRKKERTEMNKSFYTLSKELEECILELDEAKIVKDNVFDKQLEIDLETLPGGIGCTISNDNNVSFSVILNETKRGAYRILTEEGTDLDLLYENLKGDLESLASTIDAEMKNILSKYGLKET